MGGLGNDEIFGGSAKNTYSGGPDGDDLLTDFGGDDGSAVGNLGLHYDSGDQVASDREVHNP